MSRVYKITCLPTKRCYVGSTRTPGFARYRQHWSVALRGADSPKGRGSQCQLYTHMRLYSPHDFEYSVLELIPSCTPEQLRTREQHWIDRLRADGVVLYNRNKAAADPQSAYALKYATKIRDAREVCGCGASYCPTNRWDHRQHLPHRRWEQSQLLHLPVDLFS